MKKLILLSSMLFLLISCQKDSDLTFPNPSYEDEVSFRSANRPFRATIDFGVTPPTDNVSCQPPQFRVGFAGSGKALHLGKVSGQFNQCVIPGTIARNGSGVITAANGDEIHITYEGDISRVGDKSFTEGQFSIDGGTGRFMEASGGGTLSAQQILTEPGFPGTAVLEGRIIY